MNPIEYQKSLKKRVEVYTTTLKKYDVLTFKPENEEKLNQELYEVIPELFEVYGEHVGMTGDHDLDEQVTSPVEDMDEDFYDFLEELNENIVYGKITIVQDKDRYGGFDSISQCNAWLNS